LELRRIARRLFEEPSAIDRTPNHPKWFLLFDPDGRRHAVAFSGAFARLVVVSMGLQTDTWGLLLSGIRRVDLFENPLPKDWDTTKPDGRDFGNAAPESKARRHHGKTGCPSRSKLVRIRFQSITARQFW
jgi:hypothetical protein